MRRQVIVLAVSIALLASLGQPSRTDEKKDDRVQAEMKKLKGLWVEVHALAKKKPKGPGEYYEWVFRDGEKVDRQHIQTRDGEPVMGSLFALNGTYKLDITAKPKAIDIVLKSPPQEDLKYQGIYSFERDTLKLCISKEKRPTGFEKKDGYSLFVLKQRPNK